MRPDRRRTLVLLPAALFVVIFGTFSWVTSAHAWSAHIEVDRGDDSTYRVGDPLQLCWRTEVPTVANIVDVHGGTTTLRSNVNVGSSFSCLNRTVSTPTGSECFRMDYTQTGPGGLHGSISVCITVIAASGGGGSGSVTTTVSVNRGSGSTYFVGEPIQICYTVSRAIYVTLFDIPSSGGSHVIVAGMDDGHGDCINATVSLPTGDECFKIQASTSASSAVLGQAQTCIHVQQQHSASASVDIYTDRGEGSNYNVGEPIRICYDVSQPIYVTLLDIPSTGGAHQLAAGLDDGHGGCIDATVGLPTGQECFKIQASNSAGSTVLAQDQTCIHVLPAVVNVPLIDISGVNITFGKHQPDGKVVTQIWRRSADLTIDVGRITCPGGGAPSSASVALKDRVTGASLGTFPLIMGSEGKWTTTFRPPARTTDAGLGTPGFPPGVIAIYDMTLVATCGSSGGAGGSTQTIDLGEVQLIDPSGFVTDAVTKKPIAGATVTLQRQVNGDWVDADPNTVVNGSPIMNPLANPLSTDSAGHYQWDVIEGSWRVIVSATGYVTQTSRSVNIPPPVTDLNIALQPAGGGNGNGNNQPPARGQFRVTAPVLARE